MDSKQDDLKERNKINRQEKLSLWTVVIVNLSTHVLLPEKYKNTFNIKIMFIIGTVIILFMKIGTH